MNQLFRNYAVFLFTATLLMTMNAKGQSPVPDASMQRGKTIYVQRCIACHQPDGGGVPRMNPPLNGATTVNSKNKVRLIEIILKGLDDKLEMDGEFYSNNMAAHADLNDEQIADLLTYIRNNWNNRAGVISSREVKVVRKKLK